MKKVLLVLALGLGLTPLTYANTTLTIRDLNKKSKQSTSAILRDSLRFGVGSFVTTAGILTGYGAFATFLHYHKINIGVNGWADTTKNFLIVSALMGAAATTGYIGVSLAKQSINNN